VEPFVLMALNNAADRRQSSYGPSSLGCSGGSDREAQTAH